MSSRYRNEAKLEIPRVIHSMELKLVSSKRVKPIKGSQPVHNATTGRCI